MRYLVVLSMVTLLASCSLWPWRAEKTGSCLDDDSCENTNPLEEKLVGGTWYCYGSDRDQPWDCSQTDNPGKITAVPDEQQMADGYSDPVPVYEAPTLEPEQPRVAAAALPDKPKRAEMTFTDEEISHRQPKRTENTPEPVQPKRAPSSTTGSAHSPAADNLFNATDDQYAVQLIALETLAEVETFAADHNLRQPMFVRIRSQGADWHVVILGIYDNRSAAQAAATDWQVEHQPDSKPWVRPIGPLKRAALSSES